METGRGRQKKEDRLQRKGGKGIITMLCVLALLIVVTGLGIGVICVLRQQERKAQETLLAGIMDRPEKQTVIGVPEKLRGEQWLAARHCVSLGEAHPAGEARKNGCEYLIAREEVDEEELIDTGYELLEKAGKYVLYGSMLEEGQWKITQYGTVSGQQAMCYSLVSEDGKLILVDGGYAVDAPERRRLAEVFGNRVDVWICSHFHEDHIGAVVEILKEPGDLEIGEIWCPPMEIEEYLSFAKEWDTIETCREFLGLLEKQRNVRRLAGDEVQWIGNLELHILTAYHPNLDWTREGNNCGFAFRVQGNTQSMLFCCDVGNEWITKALVDYYGEKLKSDYLQMGHHGNGGLTQDAYGLVAPKVAFFDGPEWLFADRDRYNAAQNKEFMESLGCRVYLMDQAPNWIILQ